MDWLASNFVMTMIAPRRSGKSYLIKEMLNGGLMEQFDHIYIFCPSISFNDDYDDFKHEENVHLITEPKESLIMEIILKHEVLKNACKYKTDEYCPSTLLVLDDLIDSGIFNFKGVVDRIAERGRHIEMSLIVSSQRLTAVSRSVRINSDYFIIFAPASISEVEKFVEQFLPRAGRSKTITMLNDLYSEQFQFLIMDATESSWDQKLKYSKAQDFVQGIIHPIPMDLGGG